MAVGCTDRTDDPELARRVAASHPEWPNYQEDIKGQIGAGPVAAWQGTPVEVRTEPGAVLVTFRLWGPWAGREAAIPVLLEEPLEGIHVPASAHRAGDRVTYSFKLAVAETSPLPWIAIKYPRNERRIVLSPDGRWKAP